MKKLIDFLGGCCVTLFFLVTYQLMRGINFYKDCKEKIRGAEGSIENRKAWRSLPTQPLQTGRSTAKPLSQGPCRKATFK